MFDFDGVGSVALTLAAGCTAIVLFGLVLRGIFKCSVDVATAGSSASG